MGDEGVQVCLPVGSVYRIDADDLLSAAKIHISHGVAHQNPGGILLRRGDRVLQVENNGIIPQRAAVNEQIGAVPPTPAECSAGPGRLDLHIYVAGLHSAGRRPSYNFHMYNSLGIVL